MGPLIALVLLTTAAATCGCAGGQERDTETLASESELVGQLLLPPGTGSRGVEVVVTTTEAGTDSRRTWILFDEDGRFSETIPGRIAEVSVSTGLRSELYRIEADGLPEVDASGRLDVGALDLRDRLQRHRMVLRTADGAPQGDVRIALCFGLPPVGPSGEPISLGSRQFPPVTLGTEVEWLLPLEAQSIYFLIERPVGTPPELEWRGGYQKLFGPYDTSDLPTELAMD